MILTWVCHVNVGACGRNFFSKFFCLRSSCAGVSFFQILFLLNGRFGFLFFILRARLLPALGLLLRFARLLLWLLREIGLGFVCLPPCATTPPWITSEEERLPKNRRGVFGDIIVVGNGFVSTIS